MTKNLAGVFPKSHSRRNCTPLSMNFFFPLRNRRYFLAIILLTSGFLLFSDPAHSASATWSATPTNSNWVASASEINWSTGAGTFPGSTSSLNNGDTATFTGASTTLGITINAVGLNIKNITFSGSAEPAYSIGSASGNSLLLTSGGSISIASITTGANTTNSVNAPLILEPASASTAGTYTFSSASGTIGHPLVIGGGVTGGTTTQGIALTLTGANTGLNTASGIIGDGGAAGGLSISKNSSGTWILSGANTYTGGTTLLATNTGILRLSGAGTLGSISGSLTINGGILDLNGTNQSVGALNGSGGTILNEAASVLGGPKTLTIGNGNTSGSFSGTITDHDGNGSGFVKLVKSGTGTENMTSITSNYTGGTDINGGVLLSNSSNGGALGRGPITVNNTGTLGGSGVIDSAATITVKSGGTLAPGATFSPTTVAKLNTGAIDLQSSSRFVLELNAGAGPTGVGAGTLYDEVSVTGTVTLGGGNLTINPGPGLQVLDKFFIVLNDGTDFVSGTFNGLSNLSTFTDGSDTFLINYTDIGGTGLDLTPNDISLTVVGIPEPNTWIAGALALGAIVCAQRKRIAAMLAASREAGR